MRTTSKERSEVIARLIQLGVTYQDAEALRRVSMQLHSWFERECGTGNGCIERDEATGKTYWLNSNTMRRWLIPDRESGAKRRLARIMAAYKRKLIPYIQGDCRGASLYLLRKGKDVSKGENIDSVYSRGVAVY
jgi:hypothetical protein